MVKIKGKRSMKIRLMLLFILNYFNSSFSKFEHSNLKIDKVVIWGHKLHTHTSSYVHNAFYRAFKHLGYETYWFDDNDDVSHINFSNSLFYTEGQVDINIPMRDDCYYITHNCYKDKYYPLRIKKRCLTQQVFTNDCFKYDLTHPVDGICYSVEHKSIFMYWGTDLLPHEIDSMKFKVKPLQQKEKNIYWIGTLGGGFFGNEEQIMPFMEEAQKNELRFIHKTMISPEENIQLVQNSFIAPTICGKWQCDVGFVPCRTFKNISYGQMCVTNSETINKLFKGRVIFNTDTKQLFYDSIKYLESMDQKELFNLMDYVRDNHTYIQRIEWMLKIFDKVNSGSE